MIADPRCYFAAFSYPLDPLYREALNTEMAMASACGVTLVPDREPETERAEPGLFGEDQGRYLIAANEDQVREWQSQGFLPTALGKFGGDSVVLRTGLGQDGAEFSVLLSKLREAHEGWLPAYMNSVD